MMKKLTQILSAACLILLPVIAPGAAHAQFALEDATEDGVLNPVDFSRRHYQDLMKRFPKRVGIICNGAYELDKTGLHTMSISFFEDCADHGVAPSMIYLALLYEKGLGVPVDEVTAAQWLKKAAETGYSVGQYHYGMALLEGRGVAQDRAAAEKWLTLAAEQGDPDAQTALQKLNVGH